MKRKHKTENRKQKGMARDELVVVIGILLAIGVVAGFNFREAIVKGRDIQRKNDLRSTRAALQAYFKDTGSYPEALEGKIFDCGVPPKPCSWGHDSVVNPENVEERYIDPLPEDPRPGNFSYLYFSNTRSFQIFAHLERMGDAEYNEGIVRRGLMCADSVCNFGVGSSEDVRLDAELPEYLPNEE